jgi:hypothetical protein
MNFIAIFCVCCLSRENDTATPAGIIIGITNLFIIIERDNFNIFFFQHVFGAANAGYCIGINFVNFNVCGNLVGITNLLI